MCSFTRKLESVSNNPWPIVAPSPPRTRLPSRPSGMRRKRDPLAWPHGQSNPGHSHDSTMTYPLWHSHAVFPYKSPCKHCWQMSSSNKFQKPTKSQTLTSPLILEEETIHLERRLDFNIYAKTLLRNWVKHVMLLQMFPIKWTLIKDIV